MRITLSGTAGEGLPVDGCGCRVCLGARPGLAPTRAKVTGVRGGNLTLDLDPKVRVIAGTDRSWLLWMPESATGPLPPEKHAFDVVCLGGHGLALGHDIARLRTSGAIGDRTRIVLISRGHEPQDHDPSRTRDALRLRTWGVEIVPDRTLIDTRRPSWVVRPQPRRTLVLGPASSGKSLVAEELLAAEPSVTYFATGPAPDDADEAWSARVAVHRDRRPNWWGTIEGNDVPAVLAAADGPVLLDSLGTWLAGALDRFGAWDDADGWADRFETETDAFVHAWRHSPVPVVAVGEETGWGVVPATVAGGRFRELLGRLTTRLAQESEQVLLVAEGRVLEL